MDEGRKIAESVIAINKANAERARLEREVIEAAKKWVGFYNGSSEFFSDTKLAEVINALIDFESSQQQIKKK